LTHPVRWIERWIPAAALSLAGLLLAGCATLPPDSGPRIDSTALPAQGPATTLDRLAQASMAEAAAGHSGFRLLLGPGALDARIALLRGAGRSLDLQYYHLHDDATGRLVLRELRNAARRGVRVRLLLDDLYTDGLEPLLDGLGAYPNVELRLFNPFPTRGSVPRRFAAALLDFDRLNRRMHNKLFVADGALAVTGGRNLGDEYFMRSSQSNFFDYDVLAAGPVVAQMASLFDEYWNAEQVRTAVSVLRPTGPPEALRRAFDARVDGADTPDPPPFRGLDRLGRAPLADEVIAGRVAMAYGSAQAFADSPAKAWGGLETARLPSGALLDSSRLLLATEFRGARHEAWVSSPYLVPGADGLEGMRSNIQRGVRISLITNSLASTDEPVVHTGYRRYRDNMLRAGVEIFELHPRHSHRLLLGGVAQGSVIRLHTKTVVIDRERVFIGSVNFDPRSAALNTEFGVLIRSPALAEEAHRILRLLKSEASYQVRLKDGTQRDLEWLRVDERNGLEVIDAEPGADLLTRMKLYIQSILIPESLL
jgi:cardiolipin synthase C